MSNMTEFDIRMRRARALILIARKLNDQAEGVLREIDIELALCRDSRLTDAELNALAAVYEKVEAQA